MSFGAKSRPRRKSAQRWWSSRTKTKRSRRKRTATPSSVGRSSVAKPQRTPFVNTDLGLSAAEVLSLAHAVFRFSDWQTAKQSTARAIAPTWQTVHALAADLDAYRAFQVEHPGFRIDAQDEAAAAAIVPWTRERAETTAETFYCDLAEAVALTDVPANAFALVCCAVATYRWQTDCHRSLAHLGEIGVRQAFSDVTLKRVFRLPPKKKNFGPTYVLDFHDSAGNDLVWFSSRAPEDLGLHIGAVRELTARVQRHDEFRGSKQTIVTRGKLELIAACPRQR